MTRNIKERKRKKYTLIIPAKRECYKFLEKGCKIDAAGYAEKKKKKKKKRQVNGYVLRKRAVLAVMR